MLMPKLASPQLRTEVIIVNSCFTQKYGNTVRIIMRKEFIEFKRNFVRVFRWKFCYSFKGREENYIS